MNLKAPVPEPVEGQILLFTAVNVLLTAFLMP